MTASARKNVPGHAGDCDQRQKHDDGSDRGAEQRNTQFAESAANRFGAALSRIAMNNDILDNHNRVVDNQSHGGSDPPKVIRLKLSPKQTESYERNGDGCGDHQARDHGRSPSRRKTTTIIAASTSPIRIGFLTLLIDPVPTPIDRRRACSVTPWGREPRNRSSS